MSLPFKALLAALAALALALASHEVALRLLPQPPTARELGLEWVRQEFHVPDEAHARIVELHQEYFEKCDALCAELLDARFHIYPRIGKNIPPAQARATLAAARANSEARQKVLCENCITTISSHLRRVAEIMPPEEGQRFLRELLPEVIKTGEAHLSSPRTTPLQ